jgi:hypothetical protein
MRAVYLVGKTSSHHVPTVMHVDIALRLLALRLREATPSETVREWVRHDIDLLLERRAAMTGALT